MKFALSILILISSQQALAVATALGSSQITIKLETTCDRITEQRLKEIAELVKKTSHLSADVNCQETYPQSQALVPQNILEKSLKCH